MGLRTTFLRRITRFCRGAGIGRCAFGIAAVGQREFVRNVEKGRSVTLRRIEQAEAYMEAREDTVPAAATAVTGKHQRPRPPARGAESEAAP